MSSLSPETIILGEFREALPADSLLREVTLRGFGRSGFILATVPLELIDQPEMPVDETTINRLTQQIKDDGQQTAVELVDLKDYDYGYLFTVDGFHRNRVLRKLGLEVLAMIQLNTSFEIAMDRRIAASAPHASISFARVVEWALEAWQQTEWATKNISALQAFSLANSSGSTGARIGDGLKPEEATAVREWVQTKCDLWNLSSHKIWQHLDAARSADPALVRQVRLRRDGAIGASQLKLLSSVLPDRFPLQHIAAATIISENLDTKHAEQLARALAAVDDVETARQMATSGAWRLVEIEKAPPRYRNRRSSRPAEEYPLTADNERQRLEVSNRALFNTTMELAELALAYAIDMRRYNPRQFTARKTNPKFYIVKEVPTEVDALWTDEEVDRFVGLVDTMEPVLLATIFKAELYDSATIENALECTKSSIRESLVNGSLGYTYMVSEDQRKSMIIRIGKAVENSLIERRRTDATQSPRSMKVSLSRRYEQPTEGEIVNEIPEEYILYIKRELPHLNDIERKVLFMNLFLNLNLHAITTVLSARKTTDARHVLAALSSARKKLEDAAPDHLKKYRFYSDKI